MRNRVKRLERAVEEEVISIPQKEGMVRRFPRSASLEAFTNLMERLGAGEEAPPEHPMIEAARNSSEPEWLSSFYAANDPGGVGKAHREPLRAVSSHEELRQVRFGSAPPYPRSKNHLRGRKEAGVSVYSGVLKEPDLFRVDTTELSAEHGIAGLRDGSGNSLAQWQLSHEDSPYLPPNFDEGGVGKAIRDILIKEAQERLTYAEPHVHFSPVTVYGGANTTRSQGFWHVPKRDLISAGLLAYQNGKLRVGKLRYRDVLEEELANYRLKQNIATGHTAFDPLREGQHDDLLFAVCLGCWAWERATQKPEYVAFPDGARAY